ncbi:MAG: hypothetical protein KDD04_12060, partial [Sinomicrobium sp.]|nr:hypothetical protein [Sinomicrobium sp.]
FDLAYHNQFSKKSNFALGLQGSFGHLASDSFYNENNYRFFALGPYFDFNYTWLGFGYGPLFTNQQRDPENSAYNFESHKVLHSGHLRIGHLHSYFFDLEYYDFAGMHYYPEPIAAVGIVNWGFNDRTGNSNIRLGVASIRDETGYFISGKAPVGNTGLRIEAALYLQDKAMYSLGMKYGWMLPRKQTPVDW